MNKFKYIAYVAFWTVVSLNAVLADSIKITDAWVRPAPTDKNSAIYLKIVNDTPGNNKLESAHSSITRKVELHNTSDDHGVMKMHKIPSINCPAGQTTELKPGAMHIMLIGLKQDLKTDHHQSIPLNLHFSNGQDITLDVPVKNGPDCCGCHAS